MTRKCASINFEYNIKDHELDRAGSQCDLRVLFAFNAGFRDHIYNIVSKANKMFGFIRRILFVNRNLHLPLNLYILLLFVLTSSTLLNSGV